MPVVPLLAGLVAVLAIALLWLVASGRRATASVPDDATVNDLRARLDALRERYAEISDAVSALGTITSPASTESAMRESVARVAHPSPPVPLGATNVSTTAPPTIRRHPSPTVPSAPAQPPAAPTSAHGPSRRPPP
jgi:hypothetical protein